MRVPTPGPATRPARSLAAVALVLAFGTAACGASAPGTPASGAVAAASPSPALASATPVAAVPTPVAAVPTPVAAVPTPSQVAPRPTLPASLPALRLLWEKGGPTPASPETWQPAIDPATGDVWVAASFDNVFWIFSPDGRYLESWGTPGTGPGQLSLTTHEQNPSPFGSIAFLPDGSFFVADIGNNRVQKFDSHRGYLMSWGGFGTGDGQFTRAWGIRTDGRTVYTGDDDRTDIQAFDLDGHFLRSFPWPNAFFDLDPGGRIVSPTLGDPQATTSPRVNVLDPMTGKTLRTWTLPVPGAPLGVAVDATGNTFVNVATSLEGNPGNAYALVELDATGKTIGTWSTAGETAAVAPDGKAIYLGSEWPVVRKYGLPAK